MGDTERESLLDGGGGGSLLRLLGGVKGTCSSTVSLIGEYETILLQDWLSCAGQPRLSSRQF